MFAVFRRVRDLPAVRPVFNAVAGYRRPFPTFADAAAAVAGDEGGGHSNPDLDWRSETPRTLARPTIRCCFIFRVYCGKSEPCLTLPEALETLFIAIRNISTCQPA